MKKFPKDWGKTNKGVVVCFGGVFDLFHYNHLLALERAKSYGDYLVVNLSSDKQTRFKKGIERPIIPQEERCSILRALRCVDEVVCFDTEELDLGKVLDTVKPDILIANEGCDDYDLICKEKGVTVVKLPRITIGKCTTEIINKIKTN